MPRSVSERTLVFLIGAVQFVNVLDFVMVMPLGPDLARGLGIETSYVGTIGGSYTAAASVAGLAGTYFLDRFDRRKALAVSMLGLVIGTAAGGFATGLYTLLGARVLAGLFGGPATALSFAIIADLIPVERRGRALGAVMGAFSIASIIGVPVALRIAEGGNWRLPFFAVAALGLLVAASAIFFLPPVRAHLGAARSGVPAVKVVALLQRRVVQISYLTTAVVMMGSFLIVPNISAYLQQNLGYPRDRLWLLYLIGGLVSLVTLRVAGPLVDRFGSFRVGSAGSAILLATLYAGFAHYQPWLPVSALFVLFMLANSSRNVAYNTLTSRVPENPVRARFMSLQSAIQHMAAAAGAFLSSQLLSNRPDGTLGGMEEAAWLSFGLTAVLPALLYALEKQVQAKAAAHALAVPPEQGMAVPLSPEASPRS